MSVRRAVTVPVVVMMMTLPIPVVTVAVVMMSAPQKTVADSRPRAHFLYLNGRLAQIDDRGFNVDLPAENQNARYCGCQKFFHDVHAP